MKKTSTKRMSTETIVLGAILMALVIILQLLGGFVRFGPFQVSLVLIPIVIAAATCGIGVSTWLGFVFGMVVLLNGDAAAFYAIDVPGTIITVLLKGTACGFAAGLVYKSLEKVSRLAAVITAAVICPIVNTGVFLLGCLVFFLDTVKAWGLAEGYANVAGYMFLGLVGGNFLFELGTNIVLSPMIVKLLGYKKK